MKDYNEMAESLFQRREKYLAEKRRKRNALIKASSGMFCLCLAGLSGLLILSGSPSGRPDFPPDAALLNPENLADIRLANDLSKMLAQAGQENQPENSLPGTETKESIQENGEGYPAHGRDSNPQGRDTETADGPDSPQSGEGSFDVPVSEQSPGSIQTPEPRTAYADFFGGSYTDDQGRFCILLTEDTAENRSTVCRELNLDESNVIFQKASFSLSYLTQLQSKISEGMISKELDFVAVSSLREDTNRIHLTVTTQEEAKLAKLEALDSLGGALEIEYGSAVQKEILTIPDL